MLAMNGASAALTVSDIPFAGPIGAVRVGRVNGEFVANPTHDERAQSDLDLVYVGTENDVIMIEGSAKEMPEAEFTKALEFAHTHAREMIQAQKDLASRVGKPKRDVQLLHVNQEMVDIARQVAGDRLEQALRTEGKSRAQKLSTLCERRQRRRFCKNFPRQIRLRSLRHSSLSKRRCFAPTFWKNSNAWTGAAIRICARSRAK